MHVQLCADAVQSHKLSITWGSYGVCLCAELKLSSRSRLTAGWHVSLQTHPPPPSLHALPDLPLCGLFLPFTSHSSLCLSLQCSVQQSWQSDTKSAGRQRQGEHPDKITIKQRHIIGKTDHETQLDRRATQSQCVCVAGTTIRNLLQLKHQNMWKASL